MKKFNQSSLQFRLTLFFTMVSVASALFVAIPGSWIAQEAVESSKSVGFGAVRDAKIKHLNEIASGLKADTINLSLTKYMQDALVSFESVANATGVDLTTDNDISTSEYHKRIQAKFKDTFDEYLKQNNLKQFYIVLDSGSIASSATGDGFVGRNLKSGALKESPLATCFKNSMEKTTEVHFTDLYSTSDGVVAYLCQGMISKYDRDGYQKNAVMGSLIVQLNWDELQIIFQTASGLGETGEIYLTSMEGVPRTDIKQSAGSWKYADSVKENKKVTSEFFNSPQTADSGITFSHNYAGKEVLSAFSKTELFGAPVWIFTEIEASEVLASIKAMNQVIALIAIVVALVMTFTGYLISRSLSKSIGSTTESLSNSSGVLNQMSSNLQKAAGEITVASNSQASALNETASAIQEMTSMVMKSSENATNIVNIVQSAEERMNEGNQIVEQMIESIHGVQTTNEKFISQVQTSSERIKSVGQIIREIGEKTKVINEIVFQTKLLSFNASVEAARAGESGKGFAVVAEEIANLAKMSGNAAQEINSLIQSSTGTVQEIIQEMIREVNKVAEISKESVESSENIANQCGETFRIVLQNIQKINNMTGDISSASKEQESGIREINKAIADLNNATQNNSAIAVKTEEYSNELNQRSEQIFALIQSLEGLVKGLDKTGPSQIENAANNNFDGTTESHERSAA